MVSEFHSSNILSPTFGATHSFGANNHQKARSSCAAHDVLFAPCGTITKACQQYDCIAAIITTTHTDHEQWMAPFII
jgi:hypothetical protein